MWSTNTKSHAKTENKVYKGQSDPKLQRGVTTGVKANLVNRRSGEILEQFKSFRWSGFGQCIDLALTDKVVRVGSLQRESIIIV
jgi:hypothetical protein